jgi:peptidyl-prolyl cis-trans isomerase SurA
MRLHQTFKLICLAALTTLVLASPARAQNVVVMVNGEPITNYDIDQRTKLTVLSTRKAPSRQQVLDELIEEKLKIKEAKKYGVDPSSSDIDQSYAAMSSRMRLSAEQLTKTLDAQGIRPETLRSRIKADMVWGSLIRGRFKDSLLVSERDVQTALGPEDKAAGSSFEYRMRPVVLVVPQGAGSGVTEARKREAEALRERIQTCEEADGVFRSMQNATIRSTVTKTSADLPQPLRELLDKTPIGRLTPPEITRQGVEMVAVCGRSPTTIDSPKKREIREKMFTQKYEARAKAYLREIRKAGMIEYR